MFQVSKYPESGFRNVTQNSAKKIFYKISKKTETIPIPPDVFDIFP